MCLGVEAGVGIATTDIDITDDSFTNYDYTFTPRSIISISRCMKN